jgi:hypothetical protein
MMVGSDSALSLGGLRERVRGECRVAMVPKGTEAV